MPQPNVTVIIPTTAQQSRGAAIERCVRSIRASSALPVQIIAVVNGNRCDEAVCAWLQAQPDVRYEYRAAPSAPLAVLYGRTLVETEFFSTLDDDDEYLPGTTDLKLALLHADPGLDLVITNTLRCSEDDEGPWYADLSQVAVAPLEALFDQTWLNSGNALYRSARVGTDYFRDGKAYAEWTWIGFKLALDGRRVGVSNQPGNRVNVTPQSLSQTKAYFDSYTDLYASMLARASSAHIVTLIKRRISADLHDNSVRALATRQWGLALRCHLRSLFLPGGLRYLSYSRHVVNPLNLFR